MEKLKRKITGIKAGKNPRVQRSNIYLDGKFVFSLDNEVIAKEKLQIGQELSSQVIDILTNADSFQRCLNTAFQFLSYRPRSEMETRERLKKRGYEEGDIEQVIVQLKRLSLLDDTAFATFWKENRTSFNPRGQRMLKMELLHKGVGREIIDETIGDIDETENAYRSAKSKVKTLLVTDYQVFRRRLGAYLQRRGFSYPVINKVVKQTWQEKTGDSKTSPDISEEVVP
jgi:regulatory protein